MDAWALGSVDLASLAGVRVLQKNLLYVVGLSPAAAKEEVLKKKEYFGSTHLLLLVGVFLSSCSFILPVSSFSCYALGGGECEAEPGLCLPDLQEPHRGCHCDRRPPCVMFLCCLSEFCAVC